MNWADWVIILVLLVSSVISLRRGFVKEALSLSVWVVAFVVARTFEPSLAPHLAGYAETPSAQAMTAFASLFIVTLLLGSVVSYLISSLVKMAGLSNADKMFGVLFGGARGVLIILAFVLYAPLLFPFDQDAWWQQSLLIPYFLGMEEQFYDVTTALSGLFSRYTS